MQRKVINYIVSITSIIANIIFVIVIINSYFSPEQKKEIVYKEIVQNIQKEKQNTDTLSCLFQLLRKTDGWFISSAMFAHDFPEKCYVKIEIGDNELILDISQKDIIKEVKKVITALKGEK